MISSEILKTIRQIELRTNRLVNESATGARASTRFNVRTSPASRTNPPLNSIRKLKRRERRAPQSPARICAAGRNFKPIEFDELGNCGEFAIIKNQVGKPKPFSIPSNSTELETPINAIGQRRP